MAKTWMKMEKTRKLDFGVKEEGKSNVASVPVNFVIPLGHSGVEGLHKTSNISNNDISIDTNSSLIDTLKHLGLC